VRFFLLLLPLHGLLAQQAGQGVAAEWDIKANMKALAADVRTLEPLLAQVRPRDWIVNGAPDAYVRQAESAKLSVQHLIWATDRLANTPEKLTVALDALFRMQHMEALLTSLRDGTQKYQTPELANQFSAKLADNSNQREQLRQHVVDLANTREHELAIMNQEAQRCRAILSREPEKTGKKAAAR
jgi:hypothetical protein